jgi:hypothetical protein
MGSIRWVLAVLVAARLAAPGAARADDGGAASAPALTWVLELGGDRGLNELYTLEYADGSSMEIPANTGLFLAAGVAFLPLYEGRLRTHLTLGVKYTGQEAVNGTVDYYAFPVEAIETLSLGPVRLGAGLHAVLGPTVKASGVVAGMSTEMESALGFTARAEWMFGGRFGVGLHYVFNRLTAGGGSIDAPAFGLVLSATGG